MSWNKQRPIIQRKYSVDEIDEMRRIIRWQETILFGEGSFNRAERRTEIEEVLRTHMMAGTTVKELQEWSDKKDKERKE